MAAHKTTRTEGENRNDGGMRKDARDGRRGRAEEEDESELSKTEQAQQRRNSQPLDRPQQTKHTRLRFANTIPSLVHSLVHSPSSLSAARWKHRSTMRHAGMAVAAAGVLSCLCACSPAAHCSHMGESRAGPSRSARAQHRRTRERSGGDWSPRMGMPIQQRGSLGFRTASSHSSEQRGAAAAAASAAQRRLHAACPAHRSAPAEATTAGARTLHHRAARILPPAALSCPFGPLPLAARRQFG